MKLIIMTHRTMEKLSYSHLTNKNRPILNLIKHAYYGWGKRPAILIKTLFILQIHKSPTKFSKFQEVTGPTYYIIITLILLPNLSFLCNVFRPFFLLN